MQLKIKTKLTFFFIIAFIIVLLIFSGSIYYFMQQELYNSFDNKLLSIAKFSSQNPFLITKQIPDEIKKLYTDSNVKQTGNIIRILDTSGGISSDINNLNVKDLPVKKETIQKALNGIMVFENYYLKELKYPVRVLTYPVIVDGYVIGIIQIGSSLEFVVESLRKLLIILGSALSVVILITIFLGYYIVDKVFVPIRIITQKAKKISAENLDEKIGENFPDDEIGELAKTFDEMIERLKSSFDELRQFTADVSHELRTPLTVLQGEVEIALRGNRTVEEYKEILKSSLEEIKRLKEIVNALLLVSKIEAGQIAFRLKEIDMLELLMEVVNSLKSFLKEKNIHIEFDATPGIIFKGDENLLKQMFYNLIHNAIKYNKNNGEIKIKIKEEPEKIIFEIKDTGIGIPENMIENIFNRFYRIEKSRTRKEGGFGLGLNIVKKIVEIHNGKIEVESVVGKGTTFRLIFPK